MSWLYDHAHFKCSDYDKTVAFFKENFEAKEVARVEVNGMPIVTLDIGGLWYNFSPKRAGETLNEGPGATRAITGIQVRDVDYEELGAADLTVNLTIPAGRGSLNVATGVSGGVTNITGKSLTGVTVIGMVSVSVVTSPLPVRPSSVAKTVRTTGPPARLLLKSSSGTV